jgi:deoxyadenosine/deoxycytidine kinase
LYLRADVASCLERIRQRGRPSEHRIGAEYLSAIAAGYGRWLDDVGRRHAERIVVVDTNAHNIVAEAGALDRLLEAIAAAEPGLNYCNPFL